MYQSVYKRLSIVVLLTWLSTGSLIAQSFITTWKTDNSGPSNDDQITIPTFSGETYNYDVDWGDGMSDIGVTGNITHTYGSPGTYTVSITGLFPRIYFDGGGFFSSNTDHDKILTVQQWGNMSWTSMAQAFSGCTNLRVTASDSPDLSGMTDMSQMFYEASSFNDDISSWDVSSITTMIETFRDADAFNQPLDAWNVANVETMEGMFRQAENFNQSLNTWNVLNVTNMRELFFIATNFNGDITDWDVDNVENMTGMFGSSAFNRDIGGWIVDNVTTMNSMFNGAQFFDQDISSWNIGNVDDLSFMFSGATVFNADISGWNIGMVDDMRGLFRGANSFTADITGWDVSLVQRMDFMFANNTTFNQDISGWNVSSVQSMEEMFSGATAFNQNIGGWIVGAVGDMSGMFENATSFDQDISGWNVGNVDDMRQMFSGASSFDQDLGSWDVTALRFAVDMFNNSGLSVESYDALLIGWSGQALRSNVSFEAINVFYCAGEAARMILQSTFNWFITDGGQGCITVYDGNNTSFPEITNGQAAPIDFGSTAILPSTKSRSITIQNELNGDLTNVAISISGSVFSIVPAPPSTITASSTETINIVLSGATPGTFTETLTITSDDFIGSFQFDLTGVITATPEPEIAVFEGTTITGTEIFDDQVGTYYLGSDLRGNNVTDEITLTNKGSAVLNISSMSISGTAFSFAATTPPSIAVGATETIQIILDGSVAGAFTETLTITNDDTDEAIFNFDIQGDIIGPDIAVFQGTDIFSSIDEIFDGQATSVDLGTSPEGVDATLEITIANFNPLVLNISDISISGTAFSINSTSPFVIPGVIDAMVSRSTFTLTLSGASPGLFNEIVIVNNDDDDEATFEFPISGEIISSSNNSPSISVIADLAIDEDGNTGDLPFTINDTETPSNDLIVTATSDNPTLVDPNGIILGGSNDSRTINITPAEDANGSATIIVQVDDGQATVSESFSLTVNAANDAPIITGQSILTIPENTTITLVLNDFTVTDVDNDFPDGFSITINDGTNYTVNGNDVTPDTGFTGNLTAPIVINDGIDNSPVFDVIITVEGGELNVDISGAPLANGSIVNFDDIPVGAEDSRELVITNTGSIPLNITEILIDGNDFRLNSPLPDPVAPLATTTLSITFRPESIGPKTATLTIRSESAADFMVTLSASGLSEAPPLEIFNVVTVQQNGKHDFLEIRNIEFYNSNRVFIYNRWGGEVFKTGNYNNTSNRFVGDSDNGNELPDGTYYYVIELNDGETVENGFFLLRR